MAVAYTITYADNVGPLCTRAGTFTSADADGNGETLTTSTHGLNYVVDARVTLEGGGLNTPRPKVTISGGTVTWSVDNTLGYSGRFWLRGKP